MIALLLLPLVYLIVGVIFAALATWRVERGVPARVFLRCFSEVVLAMPWACVKTSQWPWKITVVLARGGKP